MASANIVSSLANIAIFIYLARVLEPEAFGYLSYALTAVFFLANFLDLGLSTYAIREIAKNRFRAPALVCEIVSFRFLLALVLAIAVIIVACSTPYAGAIKILFAETVILLFGVSLATEWAFQGLEEMRMVFVSFATTACLQIALIALFIKGPADILKVPVLYFVSMVPIIVLFLRRFRFKPMIGSEDLRKMFAYLSTSIILWLISLCAQIYNNLDIVFLGFFGRIADAGYFTVARRATSGIALLMVFLANALLPRLASSFVTDREGEFGRATKKFLVLAVALTLGVFIPLIIFSSDVIAMTVGERYLPASMPFKILMGGLILVLFNMPFSTGLIAGGFEKEILKQAASSACLSVVSNCILIPRYGMIGAAVSFVFAETLALIWILCLYRARIRRRT